MMRTQIVWLVISCLYNMKSSSVLCKKNGIFTNIMCIQMLILYVKTDPKGTCLQKKIYSYIYVMKKINGNP